MLLVDSAAEIGLDLTIGISEKGKIYSKFGIVYDSKIGGKSKLEISSSFCDSAVFAWRLDWNIFFNWGRGPPIGSSLAGINFNRRCRWTCLERVVEIKVGIDIASISSRFISARVWRNPEGQCKESLWDGLVVKLVNIVEREFKLRIAWLGNLAFNVS